MKTITVAFIILIGFSLSSCGPDFKAFENKVVDYSKSNGTISEEEFSIIKTEIESSDERGEFKRFYKNNEVNDSILKNYLKNKGFNIFQNKEHNNNVIFINLYIENSGSMNGYISGNTEFKNAIRDLLVMMKFHYGEKKINLHFINSAIHPTSIEGDLVSFSSSLNAKTFKVGNTASSNLNTVFKMILDRTSNNTISVLLSDCIYSIKGSNTEDLLSDQKSLTKDAFQSKFKNGEKLNTTIVKLQSTFNGLYYNKFDKPTLLKKQLRPYYITIIGTDTAMQDFNSKIELTKNKVDGFEQKYILTSKDFTKGNYYSVINTKSDVGRFKASRTSTNRNSIQAIEDVEISGREKNNFTFAIAIDLRKIPAEENFLTDPNSYQVLDGDYKIIAINKMDKKTVKANSLIAIQKANAHPTHYIVVQATSKVQDDFTFSLKKEIPDWVNQTSTTDDTNMDNNKDKTFGLKYLVAGITEAYETVSKSKDYFQITIKIKN